MATRVYSWELERAYQRIQALLQTSVTFFEQMVQDLLSLLVSVDVVELDSICRRYETTFPLALRFCEMQRQQVERVPLHEAVREAAQLRQRGEIPAAEVREDTSINAPPFPSPDSTDRHVDRRRRLLERARDEVVAIMTPRNPTGRYPVQQPPPPASAASARPRQTRPRRSSPCPHESFVKLQQRPNETETQFFKRVTDAHERRRDCSPQNLLRLSGAASTTTAATTTTATAAATTSATGNNGVVADPLTGAVSRRGSRSSSLTHAAKGAWTSTCAWRASGQRRGRTSPSIL